MTVLSLPCRHHHAVITILFSPYHYHSHSSSPHSYSHTNSLSNLYYTHSHSDPSLRPLTPTPHSHKWIHPSPHRHLCLRTTIHQYNMRVHHHSCWDIHYIMWCDCLFALEMMWYWTKRCDLLCVWRNTNSFAFAKIWNFIFLFWSEERKKKI